MKHYNFSLFAFAGILIVATGCAQPAADPPPHAAVTRTYSAGRLPEPRPGESVAAAPSPTAPVSDKSTAEQITREQPSATQYVGDPPEYRYVYVDRPYYFERHPSRNTRYLQYLMSTDRFNDDRRIIVTERALPSEPLRTVTPSPDAVRNR